MKILFFVIYTVLFIGIIYKHIKIRRNINAKIDTTTEVSETIKYLNKLSRYLTQIAFFVEAYLLFEFVWLLVSILYSISISISIFN